MIELINNIPASVWLLINAAIVSLIGVYFSRKKTGAEVADLITQSAARNMQAYEKRIAQLESDAEESLLMAGKINELEKNDRDKARRIASLEHDLRVYSKALHELEEQHITLEKQHGALQAKMAKWNKGIQILIKQIERHDSRPDWRPNGE
jgi:phage shock protein A